MPLSQGGIFISPREVLQESSFYLWVCGHISLIIWWGWWEGSRLKDSSSTLVISISGSRTGDRGHSGMVAMIRGRGSSAAGDSCHGRMFGFLQVLCILHPVLSPDGLAVPSQWNSKLMQWEEVSWCVEGVDRGLKGGWEVLHMAALKTRGVQDWGVLAVSVLLPSESESGWVGALNQDMVPGRVPFYQQ